MLLRFTSLVLKCAWKIAFALTFAAFILSNTIVGFASSVSWLMNNLLGIESVFAHNNRHAKTHIDDNQRLRRTNAELAGKNRRLEAEAAKLRRTAAPEVTWRGAKMPLKDAVADMSDSVRGRTKKVAAANVASMAGEAIPFVGAAVIVASVTYELKNSCDTMKDIAEIAAQIDPTYDADDETGLVCGMGIPSAQEVLAAVKSSPQAAWAAAQGAYGGTVSTIPDWQQLTAGSHAAWSWLLDTGAATGGWIGNAGAGAGSWVAGSGSSLWNYAFGDGEAPAASAQLEAQAVYDAEAVAGR